MTKLKRTAELEPASSAPPKAAPNRIVITRVLTTQAWEERTIDLIEIVKPGLLRTYRETRIYGPEKLPKQRE